MMSIPIFTTRASLSSRPCRSIVCPTGYSRHSSASWWPGWRSCESPRRDRFVRHLAEFGLVAPRGVANVERLYVAFAECAETLPELVVSTAGMLFDRIDD